MATGSACSASPISSGELGLPVSLIANAAMVEQAPQALRAFAEAEIVGHGRTNSERQGSLSEADERALIAESTAALSSFPARGRAAGSAPGSRSRR